MNCRQKDTCVWKKLRPNQKLYYTCNGGYFLSSSFLTVLHSKMHTVILQIRPYLYDNVKPHGWDSFGHTCIFIMLCTSVCMCLFIQNLHFCLFALVFVNSHAVTRWKPCFKGISWMFSFLLIIQFVTFLISMVVAVQVWLADVLIILSVQPQQAYWVKIFKCGFDDCLIFPSSESFDWLNQINYVNNKWTLQALHTCMYV